MQLRRPAILIMDDDNDLLEVLKEALSSLCHIDKVLTARSFAEVEAQKQEILDCQLAILDVNLGAEKPSGVSVAEWLRDSGFKGKIIFLTGHAVSDPEVVAATRITNTNVIAKPIGLPQLVSLIEAI